MFQAEVADPKGFTMPARIAASTAAAAKPKVSTLSPAARAEAPITEALIGESPVLAALLCRASKYARPRTCMAALRFYFSAFQ